MDSFQSILDRIQLIIQEKGFELVVDYKPPGTEIPPNTIIFAIITSQGENISHITTHLSTGDIVIGKTRQTKKTLEDEDVISIGWLGTDSAYQGQKLGILLLIYALCYLKQQNPNFKYSTLDDDSDRSTSLDVKNIYNSLGYDFQGDTAIDISNPKNLKISGPEKQLMLKSEKDVQKFLDSVNKILYTKFPESGGSINKKKKTRRIRKNIKTRKSRKNKRTRKSRKNKKNY